MKKKIYVKKSSALLAETSPVDQLCFHHPGSGLQAGVPFMWMLYLSVFVCVPLKAGPQKLHFHRPKWLGPTVSAPAPPLALLQQARPREDGGTFQEVLSLKEV